MSEKMPPGTVEIPTLRAPGPFDDIEEIIECRVGKVNIFLRHGLRLLSIAHENHPEKKENDQWFQVRSVRYVLGRPVGVPRFTHKDAEAEKEPRD